MGESDEGVVDVKIALLDALQCEVAHETATVSANLVGEEDGSRGLACSLCPFRRLPTRAGLLSHLSKSHKMSNHFVCSGKKQKRLLVALHDADMLAGREPMDLLARSAALLRSSVEPALPSHAQRIDGLIRMVLTEHGPKYVNLEEIGRSVVVRRVGNLYYTMGFANLLYREIMMSKGRLQEALNRVHLQIGLSGCETANLLPGHGKVMWRVVQDVMLSEPILETRSSLLEQMQEADEFQTLGIDGTVKVSLAIMGQAPVSVQGTKRKASAFAENECYRKVVSVVGRTGCLLALRMVREESADEIGQELRRCFTDEQLGQVRYVGADNPSRHMLETLQKLLPGLKLLFLDATHLAMNFEKCCGGKRSKGSAALRRVMAKFAAVSPGFSPGDAYDGGQPVPLDKTEVSLRDTILGRAVAVDKQEAEDFLANLSVDVPFGSRQEFVRALACISVAHPSDMKRRGHKGRRVSSILAGAALPGKCGWYFNNQVHRHAVSGCRVSLMPSGTTSNEALHNEVKQAFRQTVRLHQSTMATKLAVLSLGKLLTHTLAARHCTARQMTPGHIRARALAHDAFSAEAWGHLCEPRAGDRPLRKTSTTLSGWSRVNVAKVRAWLRKQPATWQTSRPKKRTVFCLARRSAAVASDRR